MFSESDLRDYLRIKRMMLINKWLVAGAIIFCLTCPFIGWAPFGADPGTVFGFGVILGISKLVSTTPKHGLQRAVTLLEKAINADPGSIETMARIRDGE